jgi:hypothetical protein
MANGLYVDTVFESLKSITRNSAGTRWRSSGMKILLLCVLADGLGSGVKANILATLTLKLSARLLPTAPALMKRRNDCKYLAGVPQ